jgi:uncharacterized membrane protein YvbJ
MKIKSECFIILFLIILCLASFQIKAQEDNELLDAVENGKINKVKKLLTTKINSSFTNRKSR